MLNCRIPESRETRDAIILCQSLSFFLYLSSIPQKTDGIKTTLQSTQIQNTKGRVYIEYKGLNSGVIVRSSSQALSSGDITLSRPPSIYSF